MKANELRIGNWIKSNKSGNEFKFSPIYFNDLNIVLTSDRPKPLIEPIPLTEDWLIKFGFKRIKEDKSFEIQDTYFDLNIYFPRNYFGVVASRDEIALNYNLKYVHQLQNLYFALTGK